MVVYLPIPVTCAFDSMNPDYIKMYIMSVRACKKTPVEVPHTEIHLVIAF